MYLYLVGTARNYHYSYRLYVSFFLCILGRYCAELPKDFAPGEEFAVSVPRSGNEEVRSQAQNRGVQVGDVLRGLIRRDGTEETFVSKEHAEKVINDHHRLPANHAKHTGKDDGPARAVYGTTFKLSFSRRPAAALVEKKARGLIRVYSIYSPFVRLHYHICTYVHPLYMYIHHICTTYTPNTPLNTLYTP
jgi:hypothetical protein